MLQTFRWRGEHGIVGIEIRGFLLDVAVAVRLGVGFVAIREDGAGLLPDPEVTATTEEDHRGQAAPAADAGRPRR